MFFWQYCFIKLFLIIHIFIRINTFSQQENKINSFLFKYSLLQDKHLYLIEPSMKLSYSSKQSQFLHLILQIPLVKQSTRFDNELVRNDYQ